MKDKTEALVNLIKEMGKIIRYLDENNAYLEYWLLDGNAPEGDEYVPELEAILNHK